MHKTWTVKLDNGPREAIVGENLELGGYQVSFCRGVKSGEEKGLHLVSSGHYDSWTEAHLAAGHWVMCAEVI